MVVVIGTGRWAREYAEVLLSFDIRVIIMIGSLSDALQKWLDGVGADDRVEWRPRLGHTPLSGTPVFVVSSAAAHIEDSRLALRLNCPTMVEKPIALNEPEALGLFNEAVSRGDRLCVSQVFLYSQWFRCLAMQVPNQPEELEFIDFCWVDPLFSPPRYDSSVPLFADVLPHLLAIVRELFGDQEWSLDKVNIFRGGSRAKLSLKFGNVSVRAELERNGVARKRDLRLGFYNGREIFVDFRDNTKCSIMQKAAGADGSQIVATAVAGSESPLRCMIDAFLSFAIDGKVDSRLSPTASVKSSRLADQIGPLYREQQDFWVEPAFIKAGEVDFEDFWYASLERLQRNSRTSRMDLIHQRRQHETYFEALVSDV